MAGNSNYIDTLTDKLPSEMKSQIVSRSPLMLDILKKLRKAADIESHIILIGEMGVGKNFFARVLHHYSERSEHPFHTFYCLDLNENELKEALWEQVYIEEDHLYLKYDLIEKAGNGTLYLDHFSGMKDDFMINFVDSYLRGCKQLFRFNKTSAPRLIISINQAEYTGLLEKQVWQFLLEELDPVCIMIPPLRERREDIPILIRNILSGELKESENWSQPFLTKEAINACVEYHWPGNVRQLKNAITQGAVLSRGDKIDVSHLPFSMNWKLPYDL